MRGASAVRCTNHPDLITPSSCALCGRAYCEGCLHPAPLGKVCDGCAPAVSNAALKPRPQRANASPLKLALRLGAEFLYGACVALPLVVGALTMMDLRAVVQYVDFIYEEPRRLGDVAADLVRLGAAAEAEQRTQGPQWDGESWMGLVETSVDPYSLNTAPYRVFPARTGMHLCSVGPDRVDDGGKALDRFTGEGDVCIRLRTPAMLQVR